MSIVFNYLHATWWVYAIVLLVVSIAATLHLALQQKSTQRLGDPIAAGLVAAAVIFALIAAPAAYAETVYPPPQSTQHYVEA